MRSKIKQLSVRVKLKVLACLICMGFTVFPSYANASCICTRGGSNVLITCSEIECALTEDIIRDEFDELVENVQQEFDDDLAAFEGWLINEFIGRHVGPSLARMTNQLSAVAYYYTQSIGMFLDAQMQLDTQRLFRKLQFEAHRDYLPSQDFCAFGTNARSLASSTNLARFNALALSRISLDRQTGIVNSAGASDFNEDYDSRWRQFVDTYCNPADNNYQPADTTTNNNEPFRGLTEDQSNASGLMLACDHDGEGGQNDVGAVDNNRMNIDIDYTRLIEEPRTIEVNFAQNDPTLDVVLPEPQDTLFALGAGAGIGAMQPGHEEDVIAMSRNLYGHRAINRALSKNALERGGVQKLLLATRSIIAKRGVAQASFNAIVGLKSAGTALDEMQGTDSDGDGNVDVEFPAVSGGVTNINLTQSSSYMASILNELFRADLPLATNIFEYIGYSPSYYSQLEILSKRIYQNPDFYAALYDTPANVSRKKVAMKAIELMLDREIFESQLRREMSISVLLASRLRSAHRVVNAGIKTSDSNDL